MTQQRGVRVLWWHKREGAPGGGRRGGAVKKRRCTTWKKRPWLTIPFEASRGKRTGHRQVRTNTHWLWGAKGGGEGRRGRAGGDISPRCALCDQREICIEHTSWSGLINTFCTLLVEKRKQTQKDRVFLFVWNGRKVTNNTRNKQRTWPCSLVWEYLESEKSRMCGTSVKKWE